MKREKRNMVRRVINGLLERNGYDHLKRNAKIIYLPRGSDREFYRIMDRGGIVAMFSSTRKEIEDYITIQEYLSKRDIGVPDILIADMDEKVVLMEDVGSKSLYNLVKETDDKEAIERYYKEVLKALIHLQIKGSVGIEKCKSVYMRVFDYDALRWESNYFREEFLGNLCGFSRDETEKLDEDFHNLANYLIDEPLFFMHRDFQSTNIFLKDGFVRIIDFQTAHRGMLTYDLAALLRDAYVSLPEQTGDTLFYFYFSLLQQYTDIYKDFGVFRRIYILSAIQRNMQALGAFSFLSGKKKKEWFFGSIPQGLKYLKEGLDETDEFKELKEIVYSKKVTKCVRSIDL